KIKSRSCYVKFVIQLYTLTTGIIKPLLNLTISRQVQYSQKSGR
ncbi:unnamed protein product, partial [Heterotrigona itama]